MPTNSTQHPMGSRITDMVAPTSMMANQFGPRVFANDEIQDLMGEVFILEGLLQTVSVHVAEMRHMPRHVTGTADMQAMQVHSWFENAPGEDVVFGPLTLHDVRLRRTTIHMNLNFYSEQLPVRMSVRTYDDLGDPTDTFVVDTTMSKVALVHMVRDLPKELLAAMGSMLTEIAASYYKGKADIDAITELEIAALVRLQDDQLANRVETASRVQLTDGQGVASGSEVAVGVLAARSNAPLILNALTPVIYSWLFENSPVGEKAYSLAATTA